MIKCKCERCGAKFEVPDSLIGTEGKCPACGHITKLLMSELKPRPGRARGPVRGMSATPEGPPPAKASITEQVVGGVGWFCLLVAGVVIVGGVRSAAEGSQIEQQFWLILVGGGSAWAAVMCFVWRNVLRYLRTIADNSGQGNNGPR